jgi:hypothetical protein
MISFLEVEKKAEALAVLERAQIIGICLVPGRRSPFQYMLSAKTCSFSFASSPLLIGGQKPPLTMSPNEMVGYLIT